MHIRLYFVFCYGWTMWTSSLVNNTSKTWVVLFHMTFFLPYIQPIAMLWSSAIQRGQNHWRSKNQIVERHTYHPKQKQNKHRQKTAINLGELVYGPILVNVIIFFNEISHQTLLIMIFITGFTFQAYYKVRQVSVQSGTIITKCDRKRGLQ